MKLLFDFHLRIYLNNKDMSSTQNLRLTRESVSSDPKIKMCDQDENLEMFCYTNCDSSDSDLVKRSRGLVFDKASKKIVVSTFPYTEEVTDHKETQVPVVQKILLSGEEPSEQHLKDVEKGLKGNLGSLLGTYYETYEGCVIRVFYYANKWYVATTRKLDAFKSRWASKTSFGTLFEEALERRREQYGEPEQESERKENAISWLTRKLQTFEVYTFLLTNCMENRIVCRYEVPEVYHVGTFPMITWDTEKPHYDASPSFAPGLKHIPAPKKLSFRDVAEAMDYVQGVDINRLQGVILYSGGNRQLKILNSEYHRLYSLRGNEPSLGFRYLQVRMRSKDRQNIRSLYPESVPKFEEYENLIFDACMSIYKSYVLRYIKGTHVVLPPEEFHVMKEAHERYRKDTTENKVTYNTILSILNTIEPTRLNRIIRRVKYGDVPVQKTERPQKRLLVSDSKEEPEGVTCA